jgi:transposase
MARIQGKETNDAGAVYAGCDVSKGWLDLALPDGAVVRVPNTGAGYGTLIVRLRRAGVTQLALEPTGRLHLALWRTCDKAGIGVVVIDPFAARRFAQAIGQRAKTDRVDAGVLARMARQLALPPTAPPTESLLQIRELQHLRQNLTGQSVALANQAAAAQEARTRTFIARLARVLDRVIGQIETELDQRIAAAPDLARRVTILTSIPGLGPASARALTVDLPALGRASDKEIAALIGCAPYARDSGTKARRRKTGHGRANLRRALHMAAVSAMRHNPDIRTFTARLKAAGKPGLLIVTAALRKLIILANALIKNNRTWAPVRP